jgi:hypothetical protein
VEIFAWLILIVVLDLYVTQLIMHNEERELRADWVCQKQTYYRIVVGHLKVDFSAAKEGIRGMPLDELTKLNRKLKTLKNGTTPNRKRRTEKR